MKRMLSVIAVGITFALAVLVGTVISAIFIHGVE